MQDVEIKNSLVKNLDISGLNENQKEAVLNINGPQLIIAGPGSGKTLTLTYKIAYLISKGISPEKIVAITFTVKAAEEMKERLLRLCGEIANKCFIGTFHSFCLNIL